MKIEVRATKEQKEHLRTILWAETFAWTNHPATFELLTALCTALDEVDSASGGVVITIEEEGQQ